MTLIAAVSHSFDTIPWLMVLTATTSQLQCFEPCFTVLQCAMLPFSPPGGHTGAIQAMGGSGATSGGSGSGGRIAIYHDTVKMVQPYKGSFDTQGGPVSANAETGASGTVYIKHERTGHTTVRVDNKKRWPKVDLVPRQSLLYSSYRLFKSDIIVSIKIRNLCQNYKMSSNQAPGSILNN